VRRLTETVAHHGVTAVEAAFETMILQSERALRGQIDRRVPDGEYSFRDRIDSDAVTDRPYFVDVTLRKSGGEVEIDLSASDRQATGPINFLMDDSVPKFMLGLYMTMGETGDEPGIGMNGGFERAVSRVITRPGSIVAPEFPAPLGLRSHSMIRVTTATLGALAQAMGGNASAASCVYVLYYLRGRNADGSEPLCIEGLAVGFGARTFADGIDAVYYVAQENYPIEFAEMEFGVEIERFGIHRNSGGPGRWRGGCGIVRDVRVLSDEAELGLRLDNCRQPAFGVNGGLSGQPGRVIVNPGSDEERELATMSDGNRLEKGDLVRIITSGGGGWGSPLDRPAEDVLADMLDGFVSRKAAFADYGVVIEREEIDQEATDALRNEMPRPSEMFHRSRPYNAEDDRHD
jgi:N-methylhydantoinase B